MSINQQGGGMIRPARKALFLLALGLIIPGWLAEAGGQTALPGWKGTIEVRDGVRIVANPAQPLYGAFPLEVERDLVIGDADDENSAFFYRFQAAVGTDGRILIYDPRSYRIRMFAKDGAFLQAIGKQGQGPGELQDPSALWCDGRDNLQVVDSSKLHLFDSQGRFLKSLPMPSSSRQAVALTSGTILREDREFGPKEFFEGVALSDDQGRVLQRPARYPSQKMDALFNLKPRFLIDYPEIILSPWTSELALFAYPSEYAVTSVDGRGEAALVIRKAGAPAEMTGRDRSAALDGIIAQYPRERDNRAELEKRTFLPKYRPFFDQIQGDPGGWIYVRRLRPDSGKVQTNEYDVFDKEGRFLSTVTFRGDVCLMRGGFIYAREYDTKAECVKLVRWRIKNWDRVVRGLK